MPERTFDVERVNEIANHPGVRPGLGYEGYLDFSTAISDRRNIFLLEDGGVGLFEWSSPGVYQGHLMYLPGHRGLGAIEASLRMAEYMFALHASVLWAQPPIRDRAACWHVARIGFRAVGEGEHPMMGHVRYYMRENVTCRPS